MQERHPYKITPDQGWAQMAHILEREMPLTNRPRRTIIFWWSAAAVLTAGLVMLFALVNSNSTLSPLVTDDQTSSKNKELPQSVLNESTASISTANEPIGATISEDQTIDTIESSDNTHNHVYNKSSIPAKRPDHTSINAVAIQTETQHTSTEQPVTPENVTHNDKSEIWITEFESIAADAKRNSVKAISTLAMLPVLSSSLPERELLHPVNSVEPVIKKRKLIEPYLAANVMDGYLSGMGVHAGIGANVNVLPRLSINMGGGYNMFSPSISFLGTDQELISNADADNLLREDVYNGIGSYLPADQLNSSAGNVITPFISTVLQWQATLGLKYKLSRKFAVEGGAAYTFGTTSSSAYPIVEQDYSNPATGFLKVTNSFDGYEVLKSNSTLLYAGLDYKLSPKFEFSAQWNHALEPYLINTPAAEHSQGDRTDYIRGLSLGLKYFL